MNRCENCNTESKLETYIVNDSYGRRYRNLCKKCADELSKNPEISIELQNHESVQSETTRQISNTSNSTSNSSSKTSTLYKALSIIIAVCGFIAGIVLGNYYPLVVIEYEYPSIQVGEVLNEKFNVPLMFYIWIGTAILFFAFWGIRCILKNQEMLLKTHSTNK